MVKINVKERFTDGEVDLSMSDLDDVPVKEIAALKKTYSLDLSNNRLTKLPNNFTILVNLTKLDLSKNELKELPEDFGKLHKLKHLDLYKNQLERLPLSFGLLKDLRFLDLKDNPLVPAIAKVAGPCVDNKGCLQCAKDIVTLFRKLQEEVDQEVEMRQKERQKQLEKNQQKKQQEKKNKKKEKQVFNSKKEETSSNGSDNNKKTVTNKKSNKKDQKKSNEPRKGSALWSFIKFLFSLLLVSLFTLFILSSIDSPYTRWFVPLCKQYYAQFLQKLPKDYLPYGLSVENKVSMVHKKTGVLTLEVVKFVNTNEVIQSAFNKTKEISWIAVAKAREGYNSVVELINK